MDHDKLKDAVAELEAADAAQIDADRQRLDAQAVHEKAVARFDAALEALKQVTAAL